MNIPQGKKIYFASDNHLGAPTQEASRPREKKFVAWLDDIKKDAAGFTVMKNNSNLRAYCQPFSLFSSVNIIR